MATLKFELELGNTSKVKNEIESVFEDSGVKAAQAIAKEMKVISEDIGVEIARAANVEVKEAFSDIASDLGIQKISGPKTKDNPLLNLLGGIGETLTGLLTEISVATAGALSVGIIIAQGVGKLFGGFMTGFNTVFKWLELIGKSLGTIIAPILNTLLSPLLLFLGLFNIIGRVLNVLLRPFMMASIKFFGGVVRDANSFVSKLLGGQIDLAGFFEGIKELIVVSLGRFGEIIQPLVSSIFGTIKDLIIGFLTIDFKKVTSFLVSIFGEGLGNAISFFLKALHFAASALIGFVAKLGSGFLEDISGKEETNQFMSQMNEVNKGFQVGTSVASILQSAWELFSALVDSLTDAKLPDLIGNVAKKINDWIFDLTGINLAEFYENQIKPTINSVLFVFEKFVNPTFEKLVEEVTREFLLDGGAFKKMINALNLFSKFLTFDLPGIIESFAKSIIPSSVSSSSTGAVEKDFLMRPGQPAVSFSPNDTVIGVKNPSALGGGNNITINLNVTGSTSDEREMGRKIAQIIHQEIRSRGVFSAR